MCLCAAIEVVRNTIRATENRWITCNRLLQYHLLYNCSSDVPKGQLLNEFKLHQILVNVVGLWYCYRFWTGFFVIFVTAFPFSKWASERLWNLIFFDSNSWHFLSLLFLPNSQRLLSRVGWLQGTLCSEPWEAFLIRKVLKMQQKLQ